MSITIRLARTGKKNNPSYKVVVANTKDKRNGRTLDVLGSMNPTQTPVSYTIDKKKMEEWTKKGALVTDSVKKLLDGSYTYTPYKSKNTKEQA
jgi:small subunit ribosomal protein S16